MLIYLVMRRCACDVSKLDVYVNLNAATQNSLRLYLNNIAIMINTAKLIINVLMTDLVVIYEI